MQRLVSVTESVCESMKVPLWVMEAAVGKQVPAEEGPNEELWLKKIDLISVLEKKSERQAADWIRRNVNQDTIVVPQVLLQA